MSTEAELRDQLATLTRIFAMRGLLGMHGHISVYEPERGRVYICPGLGFDKANTRPEDLFVFDLQGTIVEGQGRRPPLEWPIHTAVHAARPDARAVAHLHAPYATMFGVVHGPFRPVLLPGALFNDGVPLFRDRRLITTPALGEQVATLLGPHHAALLRNHGVVVAASDLQELLYASVLLEDSARTAVQAAALGELDFLDPNEADEVETAATLQIRARLAWGYFTALEARWDRQPPIGDQPLG